MNIELLLVNLYLAFADINYAGYANELITLIITLLPVIIIFGIIGALTKSKGMWSVIEVQKLQKVRKVRLRVVVVVTTIYILFSLLLFAPAAAAVDLDPDSSTVIAGTYAFFTCEGLTASTNYDIIRSPDGGTTNTTVHDDITSSSDGELTFRVEIPDGDVYTIYVAPTAGSGTTLATATVDGLDVIGLILPFIILMVVLGVFMGFGKKLKRIL